MYKCTHCLLFTHSTRDALFSHPTIIPLGGRCYRYTSFFLYAVMLLLLLLANNNDAWWWWMSKMVEKLILKPLMYSGFVLRILFIILSSFLCKNTIFTVFESLFIHFFSSYLLFAVQWTKDAGMKWVYLPQCHFSVHFCIDCLLSLFAKRNRINNRILQRGNSNIANHIIITMNTHGSYMFIQMAIRSIDGLVKSIIRTTKNVNGTHTKYYVRNGFTQVWVQLAAQKKQTKEHTFKTNWRVQLL